MTEKPKLKTRCYYTEYVNHMIRFYMTTPDTLTMEGRRNADIANWLAVQDVMRTIRPEDKEKVLKIYSLDYRIPKAVEMYCEETGADKTETWRVLTKVVSLIARKRELV